MGSDKLKQQANGLLFLISRKDDIIIIKINEQK